MSSLEGIKTKIKTTKELLAIVRTMKALAASSIRRYQIAYESSKEYLETISMGFQIVIKNNHQHFIKTDEEKKIGAIIFGSDLGMCGKFNDQISSFSKNFMNEELKISIDNQKLITIGEHITNNFLDRQIEKKLLFPISLDGIEKILSSVLITVEDWMLNQNIHQIILFYNKPHGESSYVSSINKILPLNVKWLEDLGKTLWKSNNLPTFFVDSKELFSDLIKEYIYISLHQAFVESLLSENISRLSAMRYAENNIQEKIEELNLSYNQLWQSSITEEILEIVEGYESIEQNKEI
ncbi:MAG: FoF1 ATP synthase subunit gamma [Parachlamydiales bacterium]|jgi:F-type H+-transporting ATPase subunit gamma